MVLLVSELNSDRILAHISISFFGFGSEEFKIELKSNLEKVEDRKPTYSYNNESYYIIKDPKDFFNKIKGRISKRNTGKLFYYIFTQECKLFFKL